MTDLSARPYQDNDALLSDLRELAERLLDRTASPDEQFDAAWCKIVARMSSTYDAQIFSAWIHVAAMFRLGAVEQHLLLLALSAGCDERYAERLHHLLRGDDEPVEHDRRPAMADSRRNGVPLAAAAKILGDIRTYLLPDATLQRCCLVDTTGADIVGMTGVYRLASPLCHYLLGLAAPQLHICGTTLSDIPTESPLDEHLVDEEVKRQLMRFIDLCVTTRSPTVFVLHLQCTDQALAASLCAAAFAELNFSTIRLDAKLLSRYYNTVDSRPADLIKALRLLCRDAVLCNQILSIVNCESLISGGEHDEQRDLFDEVMSVLFETQRYIAVFNASVERLAEAAHRYAEGDVLPVRLRVEPLGADLRRQAWLKHAGRNDLPLDAALLERLVDGYRFTEERIAIVLKDVVARRLLHESPNDGADLLIDACRAEAEAQQPGIATELRMPYGLSDLVTSDDAFDQLTEVLNHVRHRPQVVDQWGFGGKYRGSFNLSVLLHGHSGVGKTMAASIVANELGLGLYRVDLSSVLSKYIGETEKQLSQLFARAELMNVVLFFDEAEALFGKRTETRDSHDRYANTQIAYLLQRIEGYRGLVILATNLLSNMDEAFLRRFRFVIRFPFPEEPQRRILWQRAFPSGTPLASDVDFDILAKRASLAGGSIHVVALNAAFRAAADGTAVTMNHIVKSIEREYAKLGKLFSHSDFAHP